MIYIMIYIVAIILSFGFFGAIDVLAHDSKGTGRDIIAWALLAIFWPFSFSFILTYVALQPLLKK